MSELKNSDPFLIESIHQEKERLGEIKEIILEGDTMVECSKKLGAEVKEQVQKILRDKLDEYAEFNSLHKDIKVTLNSFNVLENKQKSVSNVAIQEAIGEYIESLSSWAAGTDLADVQHPYVKELFKVYGDETPQILAYWMQNDNVGCQTGMLLNTDNSVLVWHTEEDVEDTPGARFDSPRIGLFRFKDNNGDAVERHAFIYPDLLPGPAFCFGNDFFYCIDYQPYIANENPGVLANTAVWIAWRLGGKVDPIEVIENLGPFLDGYTINTVRVTQEGIEAKRIDFAHDLISISNLKEDKVLVAANSPDPNSATMPVIKEGADLDHYRLRMTRNKRALKLVGNLTGDITLAKVFGMLRFRPGNKDYASGFSNADVKSHTAAHIKVNGLTVVIGSGPATKDEKYITYELSTAD